MMPTNRRLSLRWQRRSYRDVQPFHRRSAQRHATHSFHFILYHTRPATARSSCQTLPLMNPDLPSEINQWHVVHDPYGFAESVEWLTFAERTEDILQLGHVYADGPIVDVGFYSDRYRVLVIRDGNWDSPHESYESPSCSEITAWLYSALKRYANAF